MISKFFYQVANLKKVQRTGWKSKLKLLDSESVADHTYMMSVMAMILSDIKNLNTEKIIKMSLLHDWAESKIGDFMPGEITNDEKNNLEEKAMAEIISNLPDKLENNYLDIWNDYKDQISLESKFVHRICQPPPITYSISSYHCLQKVLCHHSFWMKTFVEIQPPPVDSRKYY